MLFLETISPDNWRIDLRVKEDQQSYVASKAAILARAYAYRNYRSQAFFIYESQNPVGICLYYDNEKENAYILSQFFIDYRYQGKGYGDEGLKLIIEKIKADGRYNKILLCYIDKDLPAKKLYEKHGFVLTGQRDEDEIEMELFLRQVRK